MSSYQSYQQLPSQSVTNSYMQLPVVTSVTMQ